MSLSRSSKKSIKARIGENSWEYSDLNFDGYDPENEEKFGRILIDDSFDLAILHLFECLFEFKQFYQNFVEIRKILSKNFLKLMTYIREKHNSRVFLKN